ncbi:MAG: aminotransferase class V-fold PLP-dependent enzyme [Anaerolineae bacterium]|nr:aminotransferase class V-fold PLP-dependent enzyme [Anaerolineae bacterium]
MMTIYDSLGIKPVINAFATLTRLGGSLMPPEVIQAMNEAAGAFIDLPELQQRVGERLAELTHNEAAYVSSGAAAGLVLATAACITRDDASLVTRFPNLNGLKDEVIVHRSHRNGYDYAVRQTGVKVIEIGDGVNTRRDDLVVAITDKTAAIFWFQGAMSKPGDLPLPQVIEVANNYNIPVVVDAAAQLPPTENLWAFTQMGAALAIFSGGKDLRGPQSSGLMVGRRDLIDACRMHANPNQGMGRPMKVGKEEMAGLLAAVECYLKIDQEARAQGDEAIVAQWNAALNQVHGLKAVRDFPNEAGQPLPWTLVTVDAAALGMTRDEIVQALAEGDPPVMVAPAGEDGIHLNPMTLQPGQEKIVLERFLAIVSG